MRTKLVYRPLNIDHQEIRVLELSSAASEREPLRGRLRHVPLATAGFDAISYVWGQQEVDRSTIRIRYRSSRFPLSRRFRIEIGSNLSRALRCLRRTDRKVTLWTDRLCINQDDDSREKGQQVAMMKQIYARARTVHAWLGPSYGEPETIPGLLVTAIRISKLIWSQSQSITASQKPTTENQWLEACFALANLSSLSPEPTKWDSWARALQMLVRSNPSFSGNLKSFQALAGLPYFSRIWILQETGRAKSLTFHYGDEKVPHLQLLLALCLAYSLRFDSETSQAKSLAHFDGRFLACLTARTTCSQQRSVQDVLQAAYLSPRPTHKATNPRDLIYARLGLASDAASDRDDIQVDYTAKIDKVYTFTSRLLLRKGFFDHLVAFKPYAHQRLAATSPFEKITSDWNLPTWAYAWHVDGSNTFTRYDAAKGTTPSVSFKTSSLAEFGELLEMRGCHVGCVKHRGERFSDLVMKAGLGADEIERATLGTEKSAFSSDERQNLLAKIQAAHGRLKVKISDAEVEQLFNEDEIQMARFWYWWVLWVEELVKSTINMASRRYQQRDRGEEDNLAELLFREASARLDTTIVAEVFGTLGDVTTLVDLRRWHSLLDVGNPRKRAVGIDLMKSFFRSAWGMRVAVLDTGHLCYVPEAINERDEVVILHGIKAPLVLRAKKDESGIQTIVGPTHVRGVMEGELMKKGLPEQTYVLL